MRTSHDRATLHRALRAYVEGHDRGWTVARKREKGAPHRDVTEPAFDDRATRSQARIGVPVPERLDFHRGPDTWRSREPEAPGDSCRA